MNPTNEQIETDLKSFYQEMRIEHDRIAALNNEAIEFVKQNINFDFDLIDFDDLSYWKHEGYVEVEKTDYKNGFYPNYDFYVEKGNPKSHKYMKQDEDENFHSMVWQTTGCCEDDYSGFQLFPLSDGRYWKISFEC